MGATTPRGGRGRTWRRVRPVLWGAFFVLVGWLLVSHARQIEWPQVFDAVRAIAPASLALAASLAAASHGLYSTFDLIGRRWTGHDLPATQVVPVTFVSYAFNLNFGALVGGLGFRYRLYSRLGLDEATIGRVLGLSLATNWLGYLVLAGVVFAAGIVAPPAEFRLGAGSLRALGVALLAAAATYLVLCARAKRREYALRGHTFTLPSARMALVQLALSMLNWLAIAAVVHTLLQQAVPYSTVLGVLLVAAIAGVVTHVPAGLGVIEAVFIALLGGVVPRGELLGALLAYRALYYLAPLAVAVVVYLSLEARARKASRDGHSAAACRTTT